MRPVVLIPPSIAITFSITVPIPIAFLVPLAPIAVPFPLSVAAARGLRRRWRPAARAGRVVRVRDVGGHEGDAGAAVRGGERLVFVHDAHGGLGARGLAAAGVALGIPPAAVAVVVAIAVVVFSRTALVVVLLVFSGIGMVSCV